MIRREVSSREESTPGGAARAAQGDAIWCVHFECYKYVRVCNRCRVRIKCAGYQDYWSPRFDF